MKPPRTHRQVAPRIADWSVLAFVLISGCNFVPKSRIEEGRNVAQTLRAENLRLKDQTLVLRTKNQDLIQRAQDDAGRLAIQDEAVGRLEKSVAAYQAERDQLADAFEAFKRQVRLSLNDKDTQSARLEEPSSPETDADPLDLFASRHPDWTLDADRKSLSIPVERLFDHGSNVLKAEAKTEVASLGEAFAAASKSSKEPFRLEIEASGDASEVHQAAFNADGDTASEAALRFSAASRAANLRESILAPAGLDPTLVRIAPPNLKAIATEPRVVLRLAAP